MGTFTCPIEVISADGSSSERVDATVDTGFTYTCLPADLPREPGMSSQWQIQSELAGGRVVEDPVGEARVRAE